MGIPRGIHWGGEIHYFRHALCIWFSGESVAMCIFSCGYLFLQISVVDGFFFKAFSRLIESNLRKRKPLERHVRLQFAYLKLFTNKFCNKCITKLSECSNIAVLCSWARYINILQPCVHDGTKVYLWPVL